MTKRVMFALILLACASTMSSYDRSQKVTVREMALGMRDAFNCGLVVEQRLHGPLKDNDDGYHKQREEYNCDHVEAVLNTLDDQK
jgi:hypothetical protein